jgi:hypothetical protein
VLGGRPRPPARRARQSGSCCLSPTTRRTRRRSGGWLSWAAAVGAPPCRGDVRPGRWCSVSATPTPPFGRRVRRPARDEKSPTTTRHSRGEHKPTDSGLTSVTGPRRLDVVLRGYVQHFNTHGPDRSLDQRPQAAPRQIPGRPSRPSTRPTRRPRPRIPALSHEVTGFSAPTGTVVVIGAEFGHIAS